MKQDWLYLIKKILIWIVVRIPNPSRNAVLCLDNISNPLVVSVDTFTLFQHIKVNTKEIPCYFWQNRSSPDFPSNVSVYGKSIIPYDNVISWSFIFKLYKVKYWIDSFQRLPVLGLENVVNGGYIQTVYAQHGINYFKVADWPQINENSFSKIVASFSGEISTILENSRYNKNNIITSGLFRWGNSKKDTGKSFNGRIFIYLTNRRSTECKKIVIKKAFALKAAIEALCKNHGYRGAVYVALHHETLKFSTLISDAQRKRLIMEEEISNVKNISDVLITDYSSMAFDFLAMGKSVLFYDPIPTEKIPYTDKVQYILAKEKLENLGQVNRSLEYVLEQIKKMFEEGTSHGSEKFKIDLFTHSSPCQYFLDSLLNSKNYKNDIISAGTEIALNQRYSFAKPNNVRIFGCSYPAYQEQGFCVGKLIFGFRVATAVKTGTLTASLSLHSLGRISLLVFLHNTGCSFRFVRRSEGFVNIVSECRSLNDGVFEFKALLIPLSMIGLKHFIKSLCQPTNSRLLFVRDVLFKE